MIDQQKSPCGGCEHHNVSNLKKLGVNVDNMDYVVALTGNPNTGKSTVFNALTGLRQHTGNWPGKTVTRAEGGFSFNDKKYKLIDLPAPLHGWVVRQNQKAFCHSPKTVTMIFRDRARVSHSRWMICCQVPRMGFPPATGTVIEAPRRVAWRCEWPLPSAQVCS